jgi:SAM-dependent methyltransferase
MRKLFSGAFPDLKHLILLITESSSKGNNASHEHINFKRQPDLIRRNEMAKTEGYQKIEIADGVAVTGNDRSYLDSVVFGDGMKDQSILDIGTYHGRFCLEAMKQGASRAVGLDAHEESLIVAKKLARDAGLTPDYLAADFETWDTEEKFDVVLCLNVLHHFYDPIHAIRKMSRLARRKIVLEVAAPTVRNLMFSRGPLSALFTRGPIITLGQAWAKAHVADYTYLINRATFRVLFNMHNNSFEPIRFQRSPFKNRVIIEARKRRIKHLTVVAGPTASGKSTFVERFVERLMDSKSLRKTLNVPEDISAYAGGATIDTLPLGELDHVVLHYDLLHPFMRSLRSYDRDPVLSIFDVAERITFLTVMAPQQRLRNQIHQRELAAPSIARKFIPMLRKRTESIHERYADQSFLEDWYRAWFEFCTKRTHDRIAGNIVVLNKGDYSYHPADNWKRLLAEQASG